AEQYSREVMARVGDTSAYTASEASEAVPDEMHRSPAWAAPRTSDMDEQELTESSPRLNSSASLSWQNQTLMRNSRGVEQLFYVVTGAPPSVAQAGDESYAVFELRVRNSNSIYNHQDVVTKARLLQVLRGRRFATAYPDPASGSGWSARRQPDLEDESSRIIPVRFPRDALMRAYDADYPMARVEIEYHWREYGESRQRHYNRTGQDFVLVAPVEFMLGSKTVIRELRLDSPTRHKNDYWIPVSGVNFGPSIREPITVSYAVRTELSRGQDRSDSQSRRRGTTTTNTHTTSNTFSAQLSTGASQESSAQASVEILEVGVKRMFQMGATLGYSRTTTDTRSSAVAEEFANSITLSSSYRSSQSTNAQATLRISPPATSGPTSSRGGPPSGSSSIGVYLYPIVVFYDVPYVRFSGINRHGQATRRSEDRVAVPFIREWRLVAD
ncbi:MAG: hypothetical protein U9Q19_03995, partial [Pseudomonadota bacterium]|nr:hypothetical protein [Pseudomonadota bacterium]